jgi:hypothetical protein
MQELETRIKNIREKLQKLGNDIHIRVKSGYEIVVIAKGNKKEEIKQIAFSKGKVEHHDLFYNREGDFTYGYFLYKIVLK